MRATQQEVRLASLLLRCAWLLQCINRSSLSGVDRYASAKPKSWHALSDARWRCLSRDDGNATDSGCWLRLRDDHTHDDLQCWHYTHTHPFNGPLSGTTRVSRYQKVKPIWILLKQQTVSGTGISWAICKSAPRSRQITMPAPHRSVFIGQIPFLLPNQQCQRTEGNINIHENTHVLIFCNT